MKNCLMDEISTRGDKLLFKCVDCNKTLECADLFNLIAEYLGGIAKRREELKEILRKRGKK